MSKRQHPVSQVLKLIEGLDDNERQIVRDFLRAPRRSKSSSPAPSAGKRSPRVPKVAGPEANTPTDKADASLAASAAVGGD